MSAAVTELTQTSQAGIGGNLRQMIAVLEDERQALAALDSDALITTALSKEKLYDALALIGPSDLDEETRALARTAQQLNAVNRRVRNLLAANVSARLEALGGVSHSYLGKGRALG